MVFAVPKRPGGHLYSCSTALSQTAEPRSPDNGSWRNMRLSTPERWETNPLPHTDINMTASFNFKPVAVAMSVHCCWLRPSIFEEVSPEPPLASAHRSQTIQVSQGPTILLRPSPVTHFKFSSVGARSRPVIWVSSTQESWKDTCVIATKTRTSTSRFVNAHSCPLGGARRRSKTAATSRLLTLICVLGLTLF